jgi:hypothetical protein
LSAAVGTPPFDHVVVALQSPARPPAVDFTSAACVSEAHSRRSANSVARDFMMPPLKVIKEKIVRRRGAGLV